MAAILAQLSPSTAHTYFTVFFRALREEWFGIDRLRLDKFMLLIRRMLRQLFRRLRDAAWSARLTLLLNLTAQGKAPAPCLQACVVPAASWS